MAGLLTDSLPPPIARDGRAVLGDADQDALAAAFGRLFDDPTRGWDARMERLFPVLPRLLAARLRRGLRLPGRSLFAIEEVLGLRGGPSDTRADTHRPAGPAPEEADG